MAQASRAKHEKPVRLDADAWIAAGFEALSEGGIDAVRPADAVPYAPTKFIDRHKIGSQ